MKLAVTAWPGVRLDVDFANMAAVGPARGVDRAGRAERNARVALQRGELEQADLPVGSRDSKDAVAILEIGNGRFELLRRATMRVVERTFGGDANRRSDHEQRARAGAAEPRRPIRVAKADVDAIRGHAEDIDGKLSEGRGEALAHRLRGGEDLDLSFAGHRDGDGFLENVGAGPFQERRDALSTQDAARLRIALACAETLPVGERERAVHHLCEAAAVVR